MDRVIDRLVAPLPTEEELKKGKDLRKKRMEELLTIKLIFINEKSKESFSSFGISDKYKEIQSLIDNLFSWFNKNINVKESQVNEEWTKFTEKLKQVYQDSKQKAKDAISSMDTEKAKEATEFFPDYQIKEGFVNKDLLNEVKQKETKEQQKNSEEQRKIEEKTTLEVILQGFNTALVYFIILAYFIAGIYVAGFAVSENIAMPVGHRVLTFFYTVLFGIIWIPYYIYRRWISSEELIRLATFPLSSYIPDSTPEKDATAFMSLDIGQKLYRLFFEYKDTPENRSYIERKTKELLQAKQNALL